MHPDVHSSAESWKQRKGLSVDEWITKRCYIYTMEYYAAEKKKEFLLLWHMDGTGDYYAKLNKPVCKRPIPHDLTYNWNFI